MRPTPRVLILLCTAFTAFLLSGTAGAVTVSEREEALLDALNRARTARGLQPLHLDPALVGAARDGCLTMLRANTLTHGAFRARLATHGARGPAFGENLAWSARSHAGARVTVRRWLASPGHRANLLRPGFRRVGIGVAQGTFAGHRGAVVATATFAGR